MWSRCCGSGRALPDVLFGVVGANLRGTWVSSAVKSSGGGGCWAPAFRPRVPVGWTCSALAETAI